MALILVVDDDEPIRNMVQRLLGLHGHRATLAVDGAQALELLQANSYDLIIIDNVMPRMTGVEAVAMIRTCTRFKDLKILMFTGATVTRDIDTAFAAGVDGCIPKPFEASRLLAKIDAALGAGRS